MTQPLPRLIVITDWSIPAETLLEKLDSACSAGIEIAIQHRNPGAPIRDFIDQGRQLKSLCDKRGNALFVNGRLDVALLLGAHLHLPSQSLLPSDVRPHLPSSSWISIAVHSEPEATEAKGADFALVSPVFAPGSKNDSRPVLGTEGFDHLAIRLRCPAYALGGMTPERAKLLASAGGFAAISSILGAANPENAARKFFRTALSQPSLSGPK